MAKKNDTPTGWQPIEVPVTDQTERSGFHPIEVPVAAAPTPEPAAPAKPTPPAATPPATKSKEN